MAAAEEKTDPPHTCAMCGKPDPSNICKSCEAKLRGELLDEKQRHNRSDSL